LRDVSETLRLFSKKRWMVKERLLIERIYGALLENFLEEHLAQRRGQLIDEPRDAEIVVADDVLLGVENLADLEGDLRLLEGFGEVLDAAYDRADADGRVRVEFARRACRLSSARASRGP
jgi:hypothetical protein